MTRSKLRKAQGNWSDAALLLAGLLRGPAAAPDAFVDLIVETESDSLLSAVVAGLQEERHPSAAPVAAQLDVIGCTAFGDGNYRKAIVAFECSAALWQRPPGRDMMVLEMVHDSARYSKDYDRKRRYLEVMLAHRRLPVVALPIESSSIEVDARRDAPTHAAGILAGRGAVLVRHLIDSANYSQLIADFEVANPKEEMALAIGSLPIMEQARKLVSPYLIDLLRALFGREPQLLPDYSYMRGVKLGRHRMVPFHQDMNNFKVEMVNCWAPLTPCLGNAPRLQVVARRLDGLVETDMDTGDFRWIEESLVRDRFSEEEIVAPPLDVGDAILILGTTIHRSYYTEDSVEKRFSVELRFSTAPAL